MRGGCVCGGGGGGGEEGEENTLWNQKAGCILPTKKNGLRHHVEWEGWITTTESPRFWSCEKLMTTITRGHSPCCCNCAMVKPLSKLSWGDVGGGGEEKNIWNQKAGCMLLLPTQKKWIETPRGMRRLDYNNRKSGCVLNVHVSEAATKLNHYHKKVEVVVGEGRHCPRMPHGRGHSEQWWWWWRWVGGHSEQ